MGHRDLKLQNFLYEAEDSDMLKLIDFGLSKHWCHGIKMSQACGSIAYVAPEVLLESYTEKADCWSMGIIVYMLLTGQAPYDGADDSCTMECIRRGAVRQSAYFD